MAERATPAGADTMTRELHDLDPKHDMCLGDDPCVCLQLQECEHRAYQRGLDAARQAVKAVNWRNDEGKMLSAIVAIDALREGQP